MSSDWHSQDKGGLIEIHSDEAVEVSSEDDKAMGMGMPWIGPGLVECDETWGDMTKPECLEMFLKFM